MRGLPSRFHAIGLMKPKVVDTANPWTLDIVVVHAMTLALSPEASGEVSEAMVPLIEKVKIGDQSSPQPSSSTSANQSSRPPQNREMQRMQRPGYDPNKYCSFCRVKGHTYEECRSKNNRPTTRSQGAVSVIDSEETVSVIRGDEEKKCYFCDKTGHTAATCYEMKKAREVYLAGADKNDNVAPKSK